mmetsp:Transcript_46237/g.51569  ORF Transcript_46237/g.51569 Transcript_46237/m.51569 type:complete len:84 (-) Transcript_46237:772-1023(-)
MYIDISYGSCMDRGYSYRKRKGTVGSSYSFNTKLTCNTDVAISSAVVGREDSTSLVTLNVPATPRNKPVPPVMIPSGSVPKVF